MSFLTTLYILLAGHTVAAGVIARQPAVVTVTDVQTATVYAAPTKSSVPAGINPINSLPVAPSSHSAGLNVGGLVSAIGALASSSRAHESATHVSSTPMTTHKPIPVSSSEGGIVITPLTRTTIHGTPEYVPYPASSSDHPSSAAKATPTTSHPASETHKPESSSMRATQTSTHKPSASSSGSGQGEIGNAPKAAATSGDGGMPDVGVWLPLRG